MFAFKAWDNAYTKFPNLVNGLTAGILGGCTTAVTSFINKKPKYGEKKKPMKKLIKEIDWKLVGKNSLVAGIFKVTCAKMWGKLIGPTLHVPYIINAPNRVSKAKGSLVSAGIHGLVWWPFVVTAYTGAHSLLAGKSIKEAKENVKAAFKNPDYIQNAAHFTGAIFINNMDIPPRYQGALFIPVYSFLFNSTKAANKVHKQNKILKNKAIAEKKNKPKTN